VVAQNIFFYVIAAGMVGAGIGVVTTKNVVRAALYLIAVFSGVAAQYVLLAAEFVAVTQILVYIGAIMVLMLFGIMLTRARIGTDVDLTHSHWPVGALTALVLGGVMAYSLIDAFGDDPMPKDLQVNSVANSNTATISDAIFSQYLIPFEVVSVLLLAALVGAIVIARKDR
jgi:NADH-quinone oxidoreductase subunit J